MVWGWMWIVVLLAALTLEAVTDQLVSIWFIPAAVVATVMDFFDVPILWQVLVFLCVAAVGIAFLRRLVINAKRDDNTKTDIDAIVGERCVVTERIDTFAGCGQARVKGQIWSARGLDQDDVFEKGEVLHIVGIEGVKLICKKD